MDKYIIAGFMFLVLLALLPTVVWLWILCIEEIKEKIDYYYNIKLENSNLRDEIIERDCEIIHLKEHIKNGTTNNQRQKQRDLDKARRKLL